MIALATAGAALASFATALTAFNLVVWPRGHVRRDAGRPTSVLIPARNEAASIERCVRSILDDDDDTLVEVIVYDDRSTDATPRILARLCDAYPKLRVVDGVELPPDFVGKPHACHQLAKHATGDVLLFVDADVTLESGGRARIADLMDRHDAELVTAVPRQRMGSAFEALVMPLLHVTYTSWLPLPLIWRTHDPRFLAANGQLLAVTRDTHDAVGGFAAVRHEVVDDMAFCRRVKQARRRVVFADGSRMARCRMYDGARALWRGFSKNLYEGIGESPVALLVVIALYSLAFIAPWFALAGGLLGGDAALATAGGVGVGASVLLRAMSAARLGHPWHGVITHPVAVVVFLAIAFNSWRWSMSDSIEWAGRTYAARRRRTARPGSTA